MPVAAGLVHLARLERFDLECYDGLEVFAIGGNDSELVLDGGGDDEPHESAEHREPMRVCCTARTRFAADRIKTARSLSSIAPRQQRLLRQFEPIVLRERIDVDPERMNGRGRYLATIDVLQAHETDGRKLAQGAC